MEEFDFISPVDRPALLAITNPEHLAQTRAALADMGYKVHNVETHVHFNTRFNQVNYQVVVVEESFANSGPGDNHTLRLIQRMPMMQRRHAVFLLIGEGFETLNTMQAFAQSVHCVVNPSEMQLIGQLVQKAVADNDTFLAPHREAQHRLYTKVK
jgi:hypothetical protein